MTEPESSATVLTMGGELLATATASLGESSESEVEGWMNGITVNATVEIEPR